AATDALRYPRMLGVGFAPSTPNDARYRAAYESTIALRNRLFGN
ncbi:MAG TPA: pilus assembly protein PilW, partial [Stenotrophomonas sp.]|nr:pilus assembly protein PilW [Stenotrophomonas sp.]